MRIAEGEFFSLPAGSESGGASGDMKWMLTRPAGGAGPSVQYSGDTIRAVDGHPKVLVTEADARFAIAACESLSRAGYRLGTASNDRLAPARWSRFSRSWFRTTDPRASSRRFAQEVADIAYEGNFAAVMPGGDASLLSLSSNRDLFAGGIELGLPPEAVVDRCMNKVGLLEKAVEVGLSSPQTIVCTDEGEARAAGAELGYPVLLKPRRTVFSHSGATRQRQTFLASDEAALMNELPEFGFPCLLQRREQGGIVSVGGVLADGKLLAAVPSRYIRTWRPEAGSVAFSQTFAAPAPLIESVEGLMTSVGWEGIFELELIESSPGRFAAIDLNPRVYGSLALGVRAGASLPAIWFDWLLKGKTAACTARPGVYYRWEDADWRNAWASLCRGRFLEAASVLRPRRHTVHAYFRRYDPLPAVVRLLQVLRGGLGR